MRAAVFVSNAIIGLREGLEAALVVVILVAVLTRSGRHDALRWVWTGVGAAVAVAVLLGAVLTFGTGELGETAEPIIAGTASILATVLVTGMVLWMRTAA